MAFCGGRTGFRGSVAKTETMNVTIKNGTSRRLSPAARSFTNKLVFSVLVATVGALWVRFDFSFQGIERVYLEPALKMLPFNILSVIIIYTLFRLYISVWRYASASELLEVVLAVICNSALQLIVFILFKVRVPRSYYLFYIAILGVLTLFTRFSYRLIRVIKNKGKVFKGRGTYTNVMIVGAGAACNSIMKELETSQMLEKQVKCLIDDNPGCQGKMMRGVPIVGGREAIPDAVKKYEIGEIIIAIPTASKTEIKKLVENDTIRYIGKYRAPDYEALLEGDVDLAIESTMIYHSPQVKEAIEELGIPVLVERSSYESDPLGRLEWIRLYGLLFGKGDEAQAFFDEAVAKVEGVDTDTIAQAPSVAFFSVNSNGSVVVRKPGDYVTKMIETAGGTYALDGITSEEDNALSTMNMQMEAFYDKAVDADILIYNSTIEGGLEEMSDLTALSDKFNDFAAVKSGNVWCTDASTFQRTTGAADMIVEMNKIFAGAADDSGMEYFHNLK